MVPRQLTEPSYRENPMRCSPTILLLTCLLHTATMAAELVVAPNGSDTNPGTLALPFATLGRAVVAVRDLRTAGKVAKDEAATIRLRGGEYELAKAIVLSPEDSHLTVMAAPGERVVLSGGSAFDGWQTDGASWTAKLMPGTRLSQLFVRAPGARYATRRYRSWLGPFLTGKQSKLPARPSRMRHRVSIREFHYLNDDLAREFAEPKEMELLAIHSWSTSRMHVEAIDHEAKTVQLTDFPTYRITHWYRGGHNPYYLDNVREAFGRPGEWHLDAPSGRLRYTPTPDEQAGTLQAVAPRLERLLEIAGSIEPLARVEGIRFVGIGFAYSAWGLPAKGYTAGQGMTDLPAAVRVSYARDVRFEGCTFAHLGGYALRLGDGTHASRVIGCRFHDLGGGGILVGTADSKADPEKLPTGNRIENNVISDGGRHHFSAHGIWGGIAAETTIRHNEVRRFAYSTVAIGWRWDPGPSACREYTMEYNHLHHAMLLLCDGACIYTLGFMPGSVLRGNHLHDVGRHPFAAGAPNNGIFHDNGSKGILDDGNLIYATSGNPWRINTSNSKHEYMEWQGNFFGVAPDSPKFPKEIAAKAGLEPAFRKIDDLPVAPPPAVLAMAMPELPPPPPPEPFKDDFEEARPGENPSGISAVREVGKGTVRISEEAAASGKRSLKFTDAKGLAKSFYPYLNYKPGHSRGVSIVRFAIRLEKGALVEFSGREEAHHQAGLSLWFQEGGVRMGGKKLLPAVPLGQWLRCEMQVPQSTRSREGITLTLSLADGTKKTFERLPVTRAGFALNFLVITSQATVDSAFFVDDIEFVPDPKAYAPGR